MDAQVQTAERLTSAQETIETDKAVEPRNSMGHYTSGREAFVSNQARETR